MPRPSVLASWVQAGKLTCGRRSRLLLRSTYFDALSFFQRGTNPFIKSYIGCLQPRFPPIPHTPTIATGMATPVFQGRRG
ncbi:uncharacterized protein BDCG_17494 [Blastomyces dermatitidis ER-3]|uniref:Uncharacterized protein n=3 Tax=Blastomyces TaxID=229219 RepID=A0A179UUA7_BLAGS|nr:uncharacterized protein BDBG_07143 [Blastomyces gilchristii SLH14081]XP_045282081.1 uncharacterized protein BDCG_17494 [Blastomyces dermatitidis ER-3]KMW66753.1 hypothetical protein BDDG_11712 [Blastomyces dermatitidis ATCC 18188]OAT02354.1 hypothetical protein BDCG_17494 [Blastomyces dermatitidis ER-3]OAT11706.1 hypothetical protein BDBG_07143 [Blastomyces gilchristii SLH14081]